MNNLVFEENQPFRQKPIYFIYFLLLTILALFIYADIQQLILNKPFGDKPAPDFVLVIVTLFVFTMLVLLYTTRLETRITNAGVSYRWKPFQSSYRHFSWSDIDKAEMINYGFVGFGWRTTPFGTVHNVSGDIGLKLELKTRKKFILGTQKPQELAAFLKQLNLIQ